jgi:hypothetical protein
MVLEGELTISGIIKDYIKELGNGVRLKLIYNVTRRIRVIRGTEFDWYQDGALLERDKFISIENQRNDFLELELEEEYEFRVKVNIIGFTGVLNCNWKVEILVELKTKCYFGTQIIIIINLIKIKYLELRCWIVENEYLKFVRQMIGSMGQVVKSKNQGTIFKRKINCIEIIKSYNNLLINNTINKYNEIDKTNQMEIEVSSYKSKYLEKNENRMLIKTSAGGTMGNKRSLSPKNLETHDFDVETNILKMQVAIENEMGWNAEQKMKIQKLDIEIKDDLLLGDQFYNKYKKCLREIKGNILIMVMNEVGRLGLMFW